MGDSPAGQKGSDGKAVTEAASKVSSAVSDAGEYVQLVH